MKLQALPRNVTGFFDAGEQPRPVVSSAFERACRSVAAMEGGVVERLDLDLLGRSYIGSTIRTNADHLSVVCNGVYPYLGFVRPNAFGGGIPELEFVEPVHLAAAFSNATSFQALDASWLESDLSPILLADLASSEHRELRHWKPIRVGDVIFNAWD